MNPQDTDALLGTLESIAESLETLARLAAYVASTQGVPPEVINPPPEIPQ